MFKNALVSVSDKTGLVEFLQPFVAQGMRVVSTGGTSQHLRDHGIPVVEVAQQTGFPEMMDGRVRTLHPHIHMALLARQNVAEDMRLLKEYQIAPFDLVICNLYPFAEALKKGVKGAELIEYIDIGGPSLLRAAAKNFSQIAVVCDPNDYPWLAQKKELSIQERQRLAVRVFQHTSSYDAIVTNALSESQQSFSLAGELQDQLRYGENPQQAAWWFKASASASGLWQAEVLQGKQLSYNNILDLEAAIESVREFEAPCAVAVKHNNPCGIGCDAVSLALAAQRAVKADPVSVFGGIIALNRPVDLATAQALENIFLECIVAPDFLPEARQVFEKKKNLRLLVWPKMLEARSEMQIRQVSGGFLVQEPDQVATWAESWQVLGEQPPAPIEKAIDLAWKTVAHLKSNAIAIAGPQFTLGLGMGQVNRVDAVEQAIRRAKEHHSSEMPQAVLASDAFFPFPDSIEKAAEAGIRWIVQPGGSVKDAEVFQRAKELGISIVLTGVRHFRH